MDWTGCRDACKVVACLCACACACAYGLWSVVCLWVVGGVSSRLNKRRQERQEVHCLDSPLWLGYVIGGFVKRNRPFSSPLSPSGIPKKGLLLCFCFWSWVLVGRRREGPQWAGRV